MKLQTPIYAIALITAVCLFGDSMLYVALPTHYHEVGIVSLVEVGILLSVNRFVRLPLNPLIGYLYRRISPRQGILMAVVLAGLTTMAYGIAKGFWAWVIIRAIWGLAWSFFKIGAFLLIIDLSSDSNRGLVMGRYNGLYRLGSLVGMLGGGFVADVFGIRYVSLAFGVLAFLAIPASLHYIPYTHTQSGSAKAASKTSQGWLNGSVIWVLASGLICAMALDGLVTATLSHVIALRHPDIVKWGWISMGASTLAGTLQALRWLLGPWISPWIGGLSDRRWGRIRILAVTLCAATALMSLVPVHMNFEVWLVLIFLLLLISTLVTTLNDSAASDAAMRSSRVTVMTSYAIAIDVGAAVGPTLGYGLEALFGTASMYLVSAVVLALLTLGWAWVVVTNKRSSHTPPLSVT